MITKADIVTRILAGRQELHRAEAVVFAPANIALCKYWGKRDMELNLPVTDSLSMALGGLGSHCRLTFTMDAADEVQLNGELLGAGHPFVRRLVRFLDLFRRPAHQRFCVETVNSIPTAAGFASSASGFAAIVKALDMLYGWQLPGRDLSILARLGSGSACRSFWRGMVHWHAGTAVDGMDSFAEPLIEQWPELRIGLLVINAGGKAVGSTEAMRRTLETSILYAAWPRQVAADLATLLRAVPDRDFDAFGTAAEGNALAMHATMLTARPPVLYWQSNSLTAMEHVWRCRADGIPVYFTMDAGPNLKLIYRDCDHAAVVSRFRDMIHVPTEGPSDSPPLSLTPDRKESSA